MLTAINITEFFRSQMLRRVLIFENLKHVGQNASEKCI